MEDKYYTPEIEEFHVGFEYEDFVDNKWRSISVGDSYIFQSYFNSMLENERIRVKYLDKEDIESLGFKQSSMRESVFLIKLKEYRYQPCDGIGMFFNKGQNHVLIYLISDKLDNMGNEITTNLFVGNIKNKSELKRIMKQLDI